MKVIVLENFKSKESCDNQLFLIISMFHSFKIDGYHIDYDRIIGKGQYGVVVEC